MNLIKGLLKFSRRLFIAFMFALCIVMGVVPVMPRRKEQFSIEAKKEQEEEDSENNSVEKFVV